MRSKCVFFVVVFFVETKQAWKRVQLIWAIGSLGLDGAFFLFVYIFTYLLHFRTLISICSIWINWPPHEHWALPCISWHNISNCMIYVVHVENWLYFTIVVVVVVDCELWAAKLNMVTYMCWWHIGISIRELITYNELYSCFFSQNFFRQIEKSQLKKCRKLNYCASKRKKK